MLGWDMPVLYYAMLSTALYLCRALNCPLPCSHATCDFKSYAKFCSCMRQSGHFASARNATGCSQEQAAQQAAVPLQSSALNPDALLWLYALLATHSTCMQAHAGAAPPHRAAQLATQQGTGALDTQVCSPCSC